VLVGSDYPIDMHYMKFPNELFDKPMNELVIDTDNKIILDAHLQCAAHEMPLCKCIVLDF
jgi:DEAD/DEAH box helicase domain-containing protein